MEKDMIDGRKSGSGSANVNLPLVHLVGKARTVHCQVSTLADASEN
jgi:hypothetical protein